MSKRKLYMLISAVLLAAMMLCILPALAADDDEEDPPEPIMYINENGQNILVDYDKVERIGSPGAFVTLNDLSTNPEKDIYLLRGSWRTNGDVKINGNVAIILEDGCSITVGGSIQVTTGNTLTIYSQSDGDRTGRLYTTGTVGNAGIGGGVVNVPTDDTDDEGNPITINIPTDTACGTINIYGGEITASSAGGAGIGSGRNSAGGTIRIGRNDNTGGKVTARGGGGGAGIGGGINSNAGTITITGGTVDADGTGGGAGIGGGSNSNAGNITITGGTIDAKGGSSNGGGAGIGGGRGTDGFSGGNGGNITITGGIVKATGGTITLGGRTSGGAGIGGGAGGGNGGTFSMPGGGAAEVTATGGGAAGGAAGGAGIGGGGANADFIEAGAGGTVTINGGPLGGIVDAKGGNDASGIGGGGGGNWITNAVGGKGGNVTITSSLAAPRSASVVIAESGSNYVPAMGNGEANPNPDPETTPAPHSNPGTVTVNGRYKSRTIDYDGTIAEKANAFIEYSGTGDFGPDKGFRYIKLWPDPIEAQVFVTMEGNIYGERLATPVARANAGGNEFTFTYHGMTDSGIRVDYTQETLPLSLPPGKYNARATLVSETHYGFNSANSEDPDDGYFVVEPKTLEWTEGIAMNKGYDGTPWTIPAEWPKFANLISPDIVEVRRNLEEVKVWFEDSELGTDKQVFATGFSIDYANSPDAWKYKVDPDIQPTFRNGIIFASDPTPIPTQEPNTSPGVTATPTPGGPTPTSTPTPTPTTTPTPTPRPTNVPPTPAPTATPRPEATPAPSATPRPSPTEGPGGPTPTARPIPSATPEVPGVPSPTRDPLPTPRPGSSPTPDPDALPGTPGSDSPGGGTQPPGGVIEELPDGTLQLPDGTQLPEGSELLPNGNAKLPDGTIVYPDGTQLLPDGTIVPPASGGGLGSNPIEADPMGRDPNDPGLNGLPSVDDIFSDEGMYGPGVAGGQGENQTRNLLIFAAIVMTGLAATIFAAILARRKGS